MNDAREIKFRISDDLFVFITLYKTPRSGRPQRVAPTNMDGPGFNPVGAHLCVRPRPRRNVRAEYSAKLDFRGRTHSVGQNRITPPTRAGEWGGFLGFLSLTIVFQLDIIKLTSLFITLKGKTVF
jgi:hypothetical protein